MSTEPVSCALSVVYITACLAVFRRLAAAPVNYVVASSSRHVVVPPVIILVSFLSDCIWPAFLVRLYMACELSLTVLFQILFLMLLICVAYVSHFSLVLVLMMSDQLIKYQSSDMMSHIIYSNHNLYHCSSVE